jgi:hypothetical protein
MSHTFVRQQMQQLQQCDNSYLYSSILLIEVYPSVLV